MRSRQSPPWYESTPGHSLAGAQQSDLSAVTRAFLVQPRAAREGFLRQLSEEDRSIVFEEWVQQDDFRLVDLFDPDLSQDTFYRMERYVNGSEKWNIPSPRRTFYVAPNPDWSPSWEGASEDFVPRIETAMRHNRRQYLVIDRPMALSSNDAIKAMLEYGPTGKFNHLRGALKEIERDEYIAHEAKEKQRREAHEAREIEENEDAAKASLANKKDKRSNR